MVSLSLYGRPKTSNCDLYSISLVTFFVYYSLSLMLLSSYREVIFIKEAFYIACFEPYKTDVASSSRLFLNQSHVHYFLSFLSQDSHPLAGTFRYTVFSACTYNGSAVKVMGQELGGAAHGLCNILGPTVRLVIIFYPVFCCFFVSFVLD